MRNIITLFTLIFVLLADCPTAFAKDRGKGKPIGRDSRRREATQQKRGKKPKDKPARDDDRQERKVQDEDSKEDANKPRPERKAKAKRKQEPNQPPAKDKQKAKAKAKGKTHQQQLKAIDDQIAHEEAKHLERKARLERIRQLAEEENNQETIDRVNKLIEKEQHRHDRKITKLKQRKRKIQQRAETQKEKEQPEPQDVNE
ncbi:MAG: hypothetical protein ACYSRR_00475 [Planctomycetota bacterium]|jgi:hypothetical protein